MSAAPAVTARIRGRLARVNAPVLALYLWHMVPVVVVALVGYPLGLFPRPHLGSPGWWAFRVPWLLLLAAVMAAGLALLAAVRKVSARWQPAVGQRAGPVLLVGVGVMTFALFRFALHGFAPDGRFPAGTALLYLIGAGLVTSAAERSLVTSTGADERHQMRAQGAVSAPSDAIPPIDRRDDGELVAVGSPGSASTENYGIDSVRGVGDCMCAGFW